MDNAVFQMNEINQKISLSDECGISKNWHFKRMGRNITKYMVKSDFETED